MTLVQGLIDAFPGFNRYMVECECLTYLNNIWFYNVLIDTWWNVNDIVCFYH